jgi:uncharacterized protein
VLLRRDDLRALARGCAVLGAGGGGDPGPLLLMADRYLDPENGIEVLAAAEVDPERLVVPVGLIGAPTVAVERIWNGEEGRLLTEAVERIFRTPVAAMMPYEIGGANGLLPLIWASRLGLPLVDADGMGRAFPEMQQQAMNLAGISASPIVLTDGREGTLVIRAPDNLRAEWLVRGAAANLGGVCSAAIYAMTGEEAARTTIAGSIGRALAVGRAMEAPGGTAIERLHEAIGAVPLIEGRVVDVERFTDAGFVRGAATFEGSGADSGRRLRVELQNEFLLALEDGEVRAAVPDLICVLAADSGEPVVTERLRYGQRVVVAAAPGPEVWRRPEGLELVGPRAFGYDVDWVAVEHAGAVAGG